MPPCSILANRKQLATGSFRVRHKGSQFNQEGDFMKSASLLLLLVITLVVQSASIAATPSSHPQSAQPPSQEITQVAKIKADVQKHGTGEKARGKVTLRDKTQMKGSIIQLEDSS